jgi:rubrerythrin
LIASLAPQCAEAAKLAERIQGEERAHLRMLAERKRALGG